jgi:hypothetical protein
LILRPCLISLKKKTKKLIQISKLFKCKEANIRLFHEFFYNEKLILYMCVY